MSGSGTVMSSGGLPGSISMTNGTVAAGASLTGNVVGMLTMDSSLNLTDSTNRWELATLFDDNDGVPGVDFDQVFFNTGSLTLNGSNVLSINFAVSSNAPNFATPFWQTSHKWTVMKMSSPDKNVGLSNFVSVVTNAYHYAGTFSTAVEADGSISLNFAPAGPTAPIMLGQPQDRTTGVGSNATFTVSATGTAPLIYQWYFGSTPITDGTSSTLTVPAVQPADEGSYHVTIVNDHGTLTSSNATLTVAFPPTITSQPENQTVDQGSPVTFSVNATGTEPFAYQWKKNGTNIVGATTNSFTILSVSTNDAASFSVLVTNIAGSNLSSNAVLTVDTAPPAPPVLSLSVTAASVTLAWTSESGQTYRPQFKQNLNNTSWTDIPPDITGSGATNSITDAFDGTTNRYYRIITVP